ncbi:hypothetical protein [Archangium violaceum]|uniref:hypothetical protein n=1 Tax=Archangium violaceum TaxID=83451 RepID=UPI0037C13B88
MSNTLATAAQQEAALEAAQRERERRLEAAGPCIEACTQKCGQEMTRCFGLYGQEAPICEPLVTATRQCLPMCPGICGAEWFRRSHDGERLLQHASAFFHPMRYRPMSKSIAACALAVFSLFLFPACSRGSQASPDDIDEGLRLVASGMCASVEEQTAALSRSVQAIQARRPGYASQGETGPIAPAVMSAIADKANSKASFFGTSTLTGSDIRDAVLSVYRAHGFSEKDASALMEETVRDLSMSEMKSAHTIAGASGGSAFRCGKYRCTECPPER